MATVLRLGPADRGRPMDLDEFMSADYEEGFQYELIDGELYASPQPDAPQNWVEVWLFGKVLLYAREHPDVINYVSNKARVFVPGRRRVTNPEPDLAAYHNYPLDKPIRSIRWQDTNPVLVAEVLSADDPAKDQVRNVELYFQVPSIKEYWIIDALEEPERPTMQVRRRYGKRWRLIDVAYGDTYTTRLLPGFALLLDPRT